MCVEAKRELSLEWPRNYGVMWLGAVKPYNIVSPEPNGRAWYRRKTQATEVARTVKNHGKMSCQSC